MIYQNKGQFSGFKIHVSRCLFPHFLVVVIIILIFVYFQSLNPLSLSWSDKKKNLLQNVLQNYKVYTNIPWSLGFEIKENADLEAYNIGMLLGMVGGGSQIIHTHM